MCFLLQGPQGFTGPPGEPGEAGAAVSIKSMETNRHSPCTLVVYGHLHMVCVSLYRVLWVPVALLAPLERTERM